MENELAQALKEIIEQMKAKAENDRRFHEDLIEELRNMNRTLERLYDKAIGGPI